MFPSLAQPFFTHLIFKYPYLAYITTPWKKLPLPYPDMTCASSEHRSTFSVPLQCCLHFPCICVCVLSISLHVQSLIRIITTVLFQAFHIIKLIQTCHFTLFLLSMALQFCYILPQILFKFFCNSKWLPPNPGTPLSGKEYTWSNCHILLCIIHTHVLGPNFQEKQSFILVFNSFFIIYI